MKKYLFLDLDGTIRKPKSGAKFISKPDDQEAIEGALERCEYYSQLGYTLIGISNQGEVEARHKTLEQALQEQTITLRLFPQIESILICPDYLGYACYQIYLSKKNLPVWIDISMDYPSLSGQYRKPDSGMIRYCLVEYGGAAKDSLFVGDREEDEQAARNAKIPFILASDWRSVKNRKVEFWIV